MMLGFMMLFVVSAVFAYQGIAMHNQVDVEETKFHELQENYFSLDKATRDGAAAGSELSANLVEIQKYPSTLLQLKLVGVGKILTGIYVLLFGILIALIMMPIRLGEMINKSKK